MFLLVAHRGFPPESKIACKTQRQATESVCERQLAGGIGDRREQKCPFLLYRLASHIWFLLEIHFSGAFIGTYVVHLKLDSSKLLLIGGGSPWTPEEMR
jgi:hypothetical protein